MTDEEIRSYAEILYVIGKLKYPFAVSAYHKDDRVYRGNFETMETELQHVVLRRVQLLKFYRTHGRLN